jgi:hypothetical protein
VVVAGGHLITIAPIAVEVTVDPRDVWPDLRSLGVGQASNAVGAMLKCMAGMLGDVGRAMR